MAERSDYRETIQALLDKVLSLPSDEFASFVFQLPEAQRQKLIDHLPEELKEALTFGEATMVGERFCDSDDSPVKLDALSHDGLAGSIYIDPVVEDAHFLPKSGVLGQTRADTQADKNLESDQEPTVIGSRGSLNKSDPPSSTGESETTASELPTAAGSTGNRIQVVRRHARGAIGEVFVAYDSLLSREVALKRIREKHREKPKLHRRFVREAVITGQLQHPGIIPIYAFELGDGLTHYTMPLVAGETLATAIEAAYARMPKPLTEASWLEEVRPLLTHFIAVCNAIQYAHSRSILHRDLKPSNIMVGEHGETLVLDWGCARVIGVSGDGSDVPSDDGSTVVDQPSSDKLETRAGMVMGTIQFMSPEQAAGETTGLTEASDVFGLGATLFQLLTNQTVVKSNADPEEALEFVRKGEFLSPRELNPVVPHALAAICFRAMQRDPVDRYASAGNLADDIDRFLAGQVVRAHPEQFAERVKRKISEHQTKVAALVSMLFVGFLSLGVIAWMINERRHALAGNNARLSSLNVELKSLNAELETSYAAERTATAVAGQRANVIRRNLYASEMLLASEASQQATGIGRVRELIDNWRSDEHANLRGWEWNQLDRYSNQEQSTISLGAMSDAFYMGPKASRNVRMLSLPQRLVFNLDYTTGDVLARGKVPVGVCCADFDSRHQFLAYGFQDGRVSIEPVSAPDASKVIDLDRMDARITELRWDSTGTRLAMSDQSGRIRVWNRESNEVECAESGAMNLTGRRHFAWARDGRSLLWTTGTQLFRLAIAENENNTIATDDWISHPRTSHDGRLVAYVGPDNVIRVSDGDGDAFDFSGHQLSIDALQWHPTRNYLLSASADGSMRVWNADSKKHVRTLRGHTGHVYAATWSADGKQIVSGGYAEDDVRIWDMRELGNPALEQELASLPAVSWHPDGKVLAVAHNKDVSLHSLDGSLVKLRHADDAQQNICALRYSHSGVRIACVSARGRVWVMDATEGNTLAVLDAGGATEHFPPPSAKAICWSKDDRYIASVDGNGKLGIWDTETEKRFENTPTSRGTTMVTAWSPSEMKLAYAGTDDRFYFWDMETNEKVATTQYGWKTALSWSSDGKLLGVGDRRNVNVWDIAKHKVVSKCKGPTATVMDLEFNGAYGRLGAISEDGCVCLWDTQDWTMCAKYDLHTRTPYALSWSPDGKTLASTSKHGMIEFQTINE